MRTLFGYRIFQLIACLTVTTGHLFGQSDASQARLKERVITTQGTPAALASEILTKEKAVWEAAKLRDIARFAELVADDARMVFTSGVMTKQEYMQAVSKRTISDYSIENFQVFVPVEGTVITLYEATLAGTSNGITFPAARLRESSIWVHRAGKWVAVWNQETPLH